MWPSIEALVIGEVLILDNSKRRSLWNLSVVNLLNFTLLYSKQNMWQRKLKTQQLDVLNIFKQRKPKKFINSFCVDKFFGETFSL